jgi:transcriptional regulator GlxA family with amidase domain
VEQSDFEGYIDEHIGRPDLAPPMLARHFGISVRQLYRLTSSWGCTPDALIWSRRLTRARRILAEGKCDSHVLDIALSCGFKDGAHFSRAYRREFGLPPRDSRSRALARLASTQ